MFVAALQHSGFGTELDRHQSDLTVQRRERLPSDIAQFAVREAAPDTYCFPLC